MPRCRPLASCLLLALAAARPASADEAGPTPDEATRFSSTVRADATRVLPDERDTSLVSRADLETRQPRSAPDALRWEPGVFVQQTAHGQGSAYLRGLTGQQTVLLFDGIRVNNSTYRQGPNQYFFTIDARTIQAIEILRGGASTRFGSDALGGVIAALPIEPPLPDTGWTVRPRLTARLASADQEKGARLDVMAGGRLGRATVGVFVGGGARDVGLLQSGGPVRNPAPDTPLGPYPYVPVYADDGRTQLGTGFHEATADLRVVARLPGGTRLTAASYHYLQMDAPRTDQCPPPTAPFGTCTTYEQQFRHLSYLAWERPTLGPLSRLRVAVSYQQQHERRRYEDPSNKILRLGVDDVHTLGLTATGQTRPLRLRTARAWLSLAFGADAYLDLLRSAEELTYTDVQITRALPRGQYLDGSSYVYGGTYGEARLQLGGAVIVHGGARLSVLSAQAPGDERSGSAAVDRTWTPLVGGAGIEWRVLPALHLLANYDYSYRAPNLNDLTARQQTGSGFQYENAGLDPEHGHTFEVGVRARTRRLWLDAWAYESLLPDWILRVAQPATICPPETQQCNGSWARFQLANSPVPAEIRGVEGAVRLELPLGIWARATLAYAFGEGPRVGELAQGTYGVHLDERVPLSRIPPLNGTVELGILRGGLRAGAGLRWAAAQDRLAIADYADGRIPKYGTPGFAVVDLRASYRVDDHLLVSAVLENVFDASYRYHGSSIDGPGRGLVVSARLM